VPGTRQATLDEVRAFIRRGYELWNAGDLELVSQMWSDDIEWQNAPEWPGQRVYRGRETVIGFLRAEVADVIDLGDIDIESIRVYGDEVVIGLQARTHGQGSDLDIGKVPIFHVARVSDGMVVRVRAYLDERQALEAAQASTTG
jgi:ketosteroid isomerase-like protein